MSEQRAMILLTLPYPPLPVTVGHVEADYSSLVDGERVSTTHHLLSALMNDRALRNDAISNDRRQTRQKAVFRSFLYDMGREGFDLEGEALYRFYCNHSKKHVQTYFDEGYDPSITFKPLDDIARADPTHRKMCKYMASQSIIFHEENKPREYYATFEFIDLLKQVRTRLGHVMTEDEKALADEKEKEFMDDFKNSR